MNKPLPVVLLAATILLSVGPSLAEEYAPGVLIGAEQLKRILESPSRSVVVLDVRSQARAAQGVVPGAKWLGGFLDYRPLFGSDGKVVADQNADGVRHALFGSHKPERVVLYGESTDPAVSRAWWQLRYLGVEGATVLNGGWRAWESINGPTEEAQAVVGNGPGIVKVFPIDLHAGLLADSEAILQELASAKTPTLIDARSEREYAAGCLPNAKHLEWSELIDAGSGKLLPAEQLRTKFAAAGIDPREPAIAYCRSGGRASVTVLALAALGSEQVANYYGSWNEWSRLPGAPIERPLAEAAP